MGESNVHHGSLTAPAVRIRTCGREDRDRVLIRQGTHREWLCRRPCLLLTVPVGSVTPRGRTQGDGTNCPSQPKLIVFMFSR